MSVKSDEWIIEMSKSCGMIDPFEETLVSRGVISFGVSSYGYDVRLSDEYRIPFKATGEFVDPKNNSSIVFEGYKGKECIIPPNSFILGRSLEYFRIPRKIIAVCFGKSTYARSGVVVNVTPLEPQWEGYITISISNTSPFPVKVYSFEGICQVIFMEAERMCSVSYADRKGKYQSQREIVASRI